MKPIMLKEKLFRIAGFGLALAVFAGPLWAQEHQRREDRPSRYTVTDLGAVGNLPGGPYDIANNGLGAGAAPVGIDMHAVLWLDGKRTRDLGTPGLGGPNSVAFGVNERGHVVGQAQTSVSNAEDFCGFNAYGFASSNVCLPFVWKDGEMRPLPTLGGANGVASMINNRGEVAGFAENTIKDKDKNCPVHLFEPAVWEDHKVHALPIWPGDTDGMSSWINDKGQAVGASGVCAPFNPFSRLYLEEFHALLWENDGTVVNLGNLGGTGAGNGNHACALNNRGAVVGHSDLPGDMQTHAFLWTKETGMIDIGIPTDVFSSAIDINDSGEAVGVSLDGTTFNQVAAIWEKGKQIDLNTLVIPGHSSGLHLVQANAIDSGGEITGVAIDGSGQAHAFVATPKHHRDDDDNDDR